MRLVYGSEMNGRVGKSTVGEARVKIVDRETDKERNTKENSLINDHCLTDRQTKKEKRRKTH